MIFGTVEELLAVSREHSEVGSCVSEFEKGIQNLSQ